MKKYLLVLILAVSVLSSATTQAKAEATDMLFAANPKLGEYYYQFVEFKEKLTQLDETIAYELKTPFRYRPTEYTFDQLAELDQMAKRLRQDSGDIRSWLQEAVIRTDPNVESELKIAAIKIFLGTKIYDHLLSSQMSKLNGLILNWRTIYAAGR